MDIFKDQAQALRFSYALAAHPGDSGASHSTMVRMALNEAGVSKPLALFDEQVMGALGEYATHLLEGVSALMRHESAAVVATYSQDWRARRTAVAVMMPDYRISVTSASDAVLIDRMVVRHYLAGRERHTSWALSDIANEFKASVGRVTDVARDIERIDAELQKRALATLAERIELPVLEESHA